MPFKFTTANIKENRIVFIYEECADPGVCRIAGRVREDIKNVFGSKPVGVEYANFHDTAGFFPYPVFFGTVGNSAILDNLARNNLIDLFDVAAEKEVYSFNVIDGLEYEGFYFESAVVIAGSDNFGTIYGLFKLSEMLGNPAHPEHILEPSDSFISRTPSVKYRGITTDGELTAKAYDRLFETVLRNKGNIVWPVREESVFGTLVLEQTGIETVRLCPYLPKFWKELCDLYEKGADAVWLADIADAEANEYPYAFFMDLAYDFDRWGTSGENSAKEYTRLFVGRNLSFLTQMERAETERLLLGYTKITDTMLTKETEKDAGVPFAYGASEKLIEEIDLLCDSASNIYKKLDGENSDVFRKLVFLPLSTKLNIQKMWVLNDLNHAFASCGSTYANTLADEIRKCVRKDKNKEVRSYPVMHTFEPSADPCLIVTIPATGEYADTGASCDRTLVMSDALDPIVCGGYIDLSTASEGKVPFETECTDDFIDIISSGKNVKCGRKKRIFVFVDRMKLQDTEYAEGNVTIVSGTHRIGVRVPVNNPRFVPDQEENNGHGDD